MTLLEATKTMLRLMTNDEAIENEIRLLIVSAIADLTETAGINVGGITSPDVDILEDGESASHNALVINAVYTYVKMNFGEPDDPARLERSYDIQKRQLLTVSRGL